MQSEQPLLTIAIPTYNRSMYLAQLLEILAPQLINKPLVELMISDNSSSDDTPAVVKSFIAQGLSCRYIRNESNIGPDANFLQCFEKANGKYVWIFGDDDLIIPGGVSKILHYCETADYDLISLRVYPFTEFHMPRSAGPRHDVID